jgi:hypothetical protein
MEHLIATKIGIAKPNGVALDSASYADTKALTG